MTVDKRALTERDICTQYITPAIQQAGWDLATQVREEVHFTAGQIIVKGKTIKRGKKKRADYTLFYRPNLPIAVIEAKDNNHAIGSGMQQALAYADEDALAVPFVFSSNGDGFLFHDKTGTGQATEQQLTLDEFPSPEELWSRYCQWKGLNAGAEQVVTQEFYTDGSGKSPRYYQLNAINRAVEAIARGQNRVLLVMATGTGKTYTAFQIIWRLWKAGAARRVLFLADRNILVDQTRVNDFKPFGPAMTKIAEGQIGDGVAGDFCDFGRRTDSIGRCRHNLEAIRPICPPLGVSDPPFNLNGYGKSEIAVSGHPIKTCPFYRRVTPPQGRDAHIPHCRPQSTSATTARSSRSVTGSRPS